MVSIDSSSHYYRDQLQDSSKKPRLSHPEASCLIDLHSAFFSENLNRLQILFPFKHPEDLSKVLNQASNNFDQALQLIQVQEKAKISDDIITVKAKSIIQNLSSVKSLNDAFHIIKDLLMSREKTESSQEIRAIKDQIKFISNENALLKKAVAKLSSHAKGSAEKERQILSLSKLLENERSRSYMISLQIHQALKYKETAKESFN